MNGTKRWLLRFLLVAAWAVALGIWIHHAVSPEAALWACVPLGVARLFAEHSRAARRLLRIIAGAQLGIGIARIPMLIGVDTEVTFTILGIHALAWITLPGLVVGFVGHGIPVPMPKHLPVGYEHIVRGHRRMLAWEKLAVIGTLSLVGTSFVTGWLVLSMVWLPFVVIAYCVVRLLRYRRVELPSAPRQIRLKPKLKQPAYRNWGIYESPGSHSDLY